MKPIWLATWLALVPLSQAAAWGPEGHSIVAEIAQRRLEPGPLQKIKKLLGGEISLASIASWADDFRTEHPETTKWHFVDIPYERNTYDPEVDCLQDAKEGDCVINAIERARTALADCSKPEQDRREALMFLVHFVGDVHQPLHVAERNKDQGGNKVEVSFFGETTNLHKLWDVGIITHRVYDWGEYVRHLDRDWFPGRDIAAIDGGAPVDWALDAHKAAHDVAYDFPDDGVIGEKYYEKALAVVDSQLALAGIRLARMLNETLRDTVSCP
jgi:hypothetical protein